MIKKDTYENKNFKKFIKDMEKAGLEPFTWHGRYFYDGPAVNVKDLQDALGSTKVPCQWDSMGLGYVVYPRSV